jgi:hypothetical protein
MRFSPHLGSLCPTFIIPWKVLKIIKQNGIFLSSYDLRAAGLNLITFLLEVLAQICRNFDAAEVVLYMRLASGWTRE